MMDKNILQVSQQRLELSSNRKGAMHKQTQSSRKRNNASKSPQRQETTTEEAQEDEEQWQCSQCTWPIEIYQSVCKSWCSGKRTSCILCATEEGHPASHSQKTRYL
jgi:hypothetical protein